MREVIRGSVVVRVQVRGWLFAGVGAMAAIPVGVAAMSVSTAVLVVARTGLPAGARVPVFLVACVIAAWAMGLPHGVRRAGVRLANGLLGTELPRPLGPPRSFGDRLRAAAWLPVHTAVGGVVVTTTGLCLMVALVLPSAWLTGEGEMALFWFTASAPRGPAGAWTLLAAAACLLAAAGSAWAGTALLRRLAPVLLGPGPAERAAAAEARSRTLAQRNRLAQELHDSIGHTLTASTIQAAVARELLDRDPQAARRALSSIEETSRAAMDDLDHVVGILREAPASTRPQPTLADLDVLAERIRRTGAALTVETRGDLGHVPATVSREAYRILQECLTNTLKHGGTDGIRLGVTARGDRLRLVVTNPLRTTPPTARAPRPGHGLEGLGERVRLLRGELSAGPTGDGHWQVTADLPLGPHA
ncbi:histidine kinase [Streptomyces sp. RS10V-4]|uniref:sensor histidine kinase n=1 Tax=Streptomyces rhizoryzae TaxID=2932493 RepID=UPI002006499E|nr:histidine kinase [Streptomyces rhizoryzae]MCK7624522.1 histidine kinase [Streptomyces rhizoryzae]